MARFKLGKRPARNAIRLRLFDFIDRTALPAVPPVPAKIGDFSSFPPVWGMMANDTVGDCFFAGQAHQSMLLKRASGFLSPIFTDQDVLAAYSACTGYDPNNPNSDQGTDVVDGLKFMQTTGVKDAIGQAHVIGPYVAAKVGSWDELMLGIMLFGFVGVGLELPQSAEDQFQKQPWSVVDGSEIIGGHYVPAVGRNALGNAVVVTWGAQQEMTQAFYEKYNDESVIIVSKERLNAQGVSPQGFNYDALVAAAQEVG